ncbi:MAG: ABC transporter permease [Clostridia bacterium]|nr:ABC transporter permease [Clostridia bacterium]
MSIKGKYLSLQLKRNIKLCPSILIVTVITMCALAIGVFLILTNTIGTDEGQKMKVGIVGDVTDSSLGVGLTAVKNIDSSRFSIELIEMERDDAIEAIETGEIHGFMDIPDDFIDGILKGRNYPATYVVKKGAMNFGSIITGEITGTVSDLVIKSQSSIYSMQNLARDHGMKKGLGKKTEQLNMSYINFVLNRGKIYDIETVGVADNLSLGAYYICAIILIMIMLWGISCYSIFTKKDMSLSKLLASRGIKPMHQVICEYISYFAITMLMVIFFAIVCTVVIENFEIAIAEIRGADMWDVMAFVIKMIPVVLMICALHMIIYEAVPNAVGAVLLQFIVSIGLGYLSGCFYPNYFFPDSIQNMAAWLPSGVGFSYLRKCISDADILRELISMFVYCIMFIFLAGVMRKYKTTGDN